MKGTNIIEFMKGKKVKFSGDVNFTRLGAKEELHLLVRQLRSRALNTTIHQIRHQIRDLLRRDKRISALFEQFKKGQYSLSNFLASLYMYMADYIIWHAYTTW